MYSMHYRTICIISSTHTHTHTHWYSSHLQMKNQGRRLSCKTERLKQFLCLLFLLILHWKKVSALKANVVRPRSTTRKYTLYVLYSVAFDVRDTNKCSWPDLNSLTGFKWADTSKKRPFLISQIKASALFSARLAMIPCTPCMLENWKHPDYNRCVGTPEVSLRSSSFGLLREKHNAQNRALLCAHPLPDFTMSWSTLNVYMLNAQIFPENWSNFLEMRDTEMQTATGKKWFSNHHSLLLPSPSSLLIAVVQFYCLFLACWMVAEWRKRRKLALAKSLEYRNWHTHTQPLPSMCTRLASYCQHTTHSLDFHVTRIGRASWSTWELYHEKHAMPLRMQCCIVLQTVACSRVQWESVLTCLYLGISWVSGVHTSTEVRLSQCLQWNSQSRSRARIYQHLGPRTIR